MNRTEPPPVRFRKRWCQFHLRSLLGVVLVCVLLLGWIERGYLREQRAIALLEEWHAPYTQRPSSPTWLRRLTGDKYFLHVVEVDLRGKAMAGAAVAQLGGLGALERLDLQDTDITDADLAHVARFKRLVELNLVYTAVTEDGLKHLAPLQRLEKLHVAGTKVRLADAVSWFQRRDGADDRRAAIAAIEAVGGSARANKTGACKAIGLIRCNVGNDGLAILGGFPELGRLRLLGTLVSGSGPEELGRLTSLRTLDLSRTRFNDAGLERLANMTQLETLGLGATLVTDAGLEYLKHHEKLKVLELYYTDVTDAGLDHLNGLKKLEKLNLVGTRVSELGVGRLQAALPDAVIIY